MCALAVLLRAGSAVKESARGRGGVEVKMVAAGHVACLAAAVVV
jgi:hypothetical protein